MKKSFFFGMLLCAALAACLACACSDSNEEPPTPPQPVIPDDYIEFPDKTLAARLLESGVDTDKDGYIIPAEAAKVTQLSFIHTDDGSDKIVSLEGLEHFTALESLSIAFNAVTSLAPVAKLPVLDMLDANDNELTEVDLSELPELRILNLKNNPLAGDCDLKPCRALEQVDLSGTRITTLDVSGLPKLESVVAQLCKDLYRLTATHCPELILIAARGSKIAGVTIVSDPKLQFLDLSDCDLVSHSQPLFTEQLPALKKIDVSGNKARMQDQTPFFDVLDLSLFPALEECIISNTLFPVLDFSKNPALKRLEAEHMEELVRIDLHNDAFVAEAEYKIVEGNEALATVIVDPGEEKTYVEGLFAADPDVTVTDDPKGGSGDLFVPRPAPADGPVDTEPYPESIGMLMFFPEFNLYGQTLDEAKSYEAGKGEVREEMTSQADELTIHVFYVGTDKTIYRTYWTDADGAIDHVAIYSPRAKFLVRKDGKWMMNPDFAPVDNSYRSLTFEEERDGCFYYTAGKPACRIAIRAVVVGEEELAELVFTKI